MQAPQLWTLSLFAAKHILHGIKTKLASTAEAPSLPRTCFRPRLLRPEKQSSELATDVFLTISQWKKQFTRCVSCIALGWGLLLLSFHARF